MGSFSIWHWLVVLAVVVLVFGTKKLKNLGGDLGGAVKGFKDALDEEKKEADGKDDLFEQKTVENDANYKDHK